MGYPITQRFLTGLNRPTIAHVVNEGKVRADDYLNPPQGVVVHSTDTPGATDENEHDYLETHPTVQTSSHYGVDWDSITYQIPENEIAWHGGYHANHMYLSIEMSEPRDDDPDRVRKFNEIWARTVWLVADMCVRRGWGTGPNVWSHKGITMRYPKETTHTDPYGYFAKYGKTWSQFLQDVDAEISRLKNPPPPVVIVNPSDNQPKPEPKAGEPKEDPKTPDPQPSAKEETPTNKFFSKKLFAFISTVGVILLNAYQAGQMTQTDIYALVAAFAAYVGAQGYVDSKK